MKLKEFALKTLLPALVTLSAGTEAFTVQIQWTHARHQQETAKAVQTAAQEQWRAEQERRGHLIVTLARGCKLGGG